MQRTRELRSSWFYGGDLGEPGDDVRPERTSVAEVSLPAPYPFSLG